MKGVILAAGKGTRMESDLAKVLHPLCGRPLLAWVLETARVLQPERVVAVVGHQADAVKEAVRHNYPNTEFALQSEMLGTGHAVQQAEGILKNFEGDIIVTCGDAPLIGAETFRALVETRLGVPLEDALDGVAERFDSDDLHWAVMAIRIQREVGGNLAELLDTVAATMREREYVRRQVAALSAEGRLSAWVLGCLPVLFLLYMLVANGDYVMPLFTDPRGLVMLGLGAVLLGVGAFWMSRLVKVEV